MTCNTKNCIYVLKCAGCLKMYIGETSCLRSRTNLHRDHSNRNTGLGVSRHLFSCAQGSGPKFVIMPFFKMSNDDQMQRRTKEEYLI